MTELFGAASSILASFMASLVEFVEALTIVLAVGVVRGWRSALLGAATALVVLLALVVVLGPALAHIPLEIVQLVVGTLLLLFGLRWLRKAILRTAGVLALHDEAKAFEEETTQLRQRGQVSRRGIDSVAFGTSFKIVMLEGIEVVFIVIAVGAGGTMLASAIMGAALALCVVILLGLWLHRPLARVPENTLKFCVGVLLSAFGCFWVGEGIGLSWPGSDVALLALVVVFLVAALILVPICRSLKASASHRPGKPSIPPKQELFPKGILSVVTDELFGLFVDDGWLAGGVLIWVALAWGVESTAPLLAVVAAVLLTGGLIVVLSASAARRAQA